MNNHLSKNNKECAFQANFKGFVQFLTWSWCVWPHLDKQQQKKLGPLIRSLLPSSK